MTSFPLNIEMSINSGLKCSQALPPALHKHHVTIPHTLQIVQLWVIPKARHKACLYPSLTTHPKALPTAVTATIYFCVCKYYFKAILAKSRVR